MRSIDRRQLLVILLAVGLLFAGTVSGSGHLAVGSQFTTESDFQNAQELTNVSIEGSGDAASVTLGSDPGSDGFEDGDITEYTAEGTDTADWSVVSANARSGTNALSFAADSNAAIEGLMREQVEGDNLTVEMWTQLGSGTQSGFIFSDSVGSSGIEFQIREGNNDLQVFNRGTNTNEGTNGTAINPDTYYYTAVEYSSGSYTFYLDDDENYSNDPIATVSGSYNADGLQYGIFAGDFSGPGTNYYDEFQSRQFAEQAESARYVGQLHSVSNAKEARIDLDQVSDVSVDAEVRTDSGTTLAAKTITSQGNHALNLSETSSSQLQTVLDITVTGENPQFSLADESILFADQEPQLSSGSPTSGTTVTETPVELSINVSDADFGTVQSDSVDITFYDASDDSQIGTDTLTANGTASTNWDGLEGGENQYYIQATDSYGNEVTSQTFIFNAPSTLRLLNESDPDQLVTTNSEVEVTFFSGEQVITRTTTDGTVDLTGLPADETFTVQVEANGYVTRQAVIQGIVEQQNIYLLPESVESVATRFTIDDPTGQFATSNTRIAVKKPITKNGSTEYEIVASDIAGEGGYATILQQDQRYLLEVTNTETGNTRSLGPYVATEAQTVNLRIEALDFQFGSNEAGYQWDAAYENDTEPAISFDWKTTTATAQTLDVTIRERGGDGTVIFDESYTEPEQVSELAIIGDSVENPQATTWLVEWEATLADGNTVSGSAVAGPSKLPVKMPNVPDQVVSVLSILIILLVAGLFSAANVTVGAIVTSLTAGGLWFVGATPGAVTGGLVSLALFVAVIAHLRTNQQISPR